LRWLHGHHRAVARDYEKLDSGHPRVILRDTVASAPMALCACVVRVPSAWIQPLVPGLFSLRLVLLLLFRLTAGRVWSHPRGFAAPHYVMVVGTGSAPFGCGGAGTIAEYGVPVARFLSEQTEDAPAEIALARSTKCRPLASCPPFCRSTWWHNHLPWHESLADLEEVFCVAEEGVRSGWRGFLPGSKARCRWTAWLDARADFPAAP